MESETMEVRKVGNMFRTRSHEKKKSWWFDEIIFSVIKKNKK